MINITTILNILLSVSTSMFELVLLVLAGFILRLTGIMDRQMTRRVSQLMFYVCAPCFESVAIAKAFSFDAMSKLWICPTVAILNLLIGHTLGQLFFLFRRDLPGRLGIMGSSFYNFSSIPFVFIGALIKSNVFKGSQTELEGKAFGYISMFLAPNIFATFSYGYVFLSFNFNDLKKIGNTCGISRKSKNQIKNEDKDITSNEIESNKNHELEQKDKPELVDTLLEEDTLGTRVKEEEVFIKSDSYEVLVPPISISNIEISKKLEHMGTQTIQHSSFSIKNENIVVKNTKFSQFKKITGFIFSNIITPPICGMIIAFLIAAHPVVKKHVLTEPPIIMSSIWNVISTMSGGYFSLSMFMLGSNLCSAIFTIPKEKAVKMKKIVILKKVSNQTDTTKTTTLNEVTAINSSLSTQNNSNQHNPIDNSPITLLSTEESLIKQIDLSNSISIDDFSVNQLKPSVVEEIIEITEAIEDSPANPSDMYAFPELNLQPTSDTKKVIEVTLDSNENESSIASTRDNNEQKEESQIIEVPVKSFWEKICPSFIWFIHKKIISRYILKFNSYSALFRVILIKLFLLPLIMLGIVNLLTHFNIIDNDPILFVVLMVEASTPCSTSMVMLCNICCDQGVEIMAELTLFSYMLAPFTLIFWTSIYMVNACSYNSSLCNI